jgi:hypothetical protein
VRHAPSHAGKLPAWERLVFAAIFALMTAFVVAVTMSAVKRGSLPVADGNSSAASSATGRLQPVTSGGGQRSAGRSSATGHTSSGGSLDQRLAAALSPLLRSKVGHFAVGVINISTGARAVFDAANPFRTAGLEKVDILAALLLEHQQAGTLVTSQQAALAVPMIDSGSEAAATDLYQAVGGPAGMTSVNAQLGLTNTEMGPLGQGGLTKTTVSDQLRLLADLTARTSVLSPASQDYELDLMADVQTSQRWGVSVAATPGTRYAIKDGWLPDPATWVTNSMGVVDHDGQRLLIVVLASGQPTEAVGIALDGAAAADAARVVTGG